MTERRFFHSLLSESCINYYYIVAGDAGIHGRERRGRFEEGCLGADQIELDRNILISETILYDENIFIDAELYRKWDRSLSFEGEEYSLSEVGIKK